MAERQIRRCAACATALAVAIVAAPLHATAGTTTGPRLALTPNQGGLGSHFTATFSYTVPACDEYEVQLIWNPAAPQLIGTAHPTNSGQACQVTIPATVPSNAEPGITYAVAAAAHLATPNGTGGWSSNDPQASAPYAVTRPPSTTTSSTSTSAHSSEESTRSLPTSAVPSSSSERTETSSSPDAAAAAAPGSPESPSSDAPSSAGDLPSAAATTAQPHGMGWTLAIGVGAVALLALLGVALARRAGGLRKPG